MARADATGLDSWIDAAGLDRLVARRRRLRRAADLREVVAMIVVLLLLHFADAGLGRDHLLRVERGAGLDAIRAGELRLARQTELAHELTALVAARALAVASARVRALAAAGAVHGVLPVAVDALRLHGHGDFVHVRGAGRAAVDDLLAGEVDAVVAVRSGHAAASVVRRLPIGGV